LKAVLPNGEIVGIGVETAKGVVGYDLTRLIVGSEGTLAIITEITLRLIPRPEKRERFWSFSLIFFCCTGCIKHNQRKDCSNYHRIYG